MHPSKSTTVLVQSQAERGHAAPQSVIARTESKAPWPLLSGSRDQAYADGGLDYDLEGIAAEISQEMSATFPNDLTRIIYLASLRDYNTGRYLHPTFSFKHESHLASEALRKCHEVAFNRLLGTPVKEYVCQLRAYIGLSKAAPRELIRIWKDLRVYTAALPLHKQDLARDTFLLSLETALLVLENESTSYSSVD